MSGIDETRGSERISAAIQVTYEVHESMKGSVPFSDKKHSADIVDISATGCSIRSNVFVPKNILLNMEIDGTQFYEGGKKIINATGKICNCRNISKDSYRLGISFEKISAEDKQAIKRFVDSRDRRKEKRLPLGPDQPTSPTAQ